MFQIQVISGVWAKIMELELFLKCVIII